MQVRRVYRDTAGPPFAAGRDLKEESVSIRLPIAIY
jgi:hypothetical protein